MPKEVKVTLKQLKSFLKGMTSGTINNEALTDMIPVLNKTFKEKVLNVPHEGGVYEIPTKTDLEILIMSSDNISHKPLKVPREAHYNSDYLRRKQLMNQGPHTYLRLGIIHGTSVYKTGERVVMKTAESAVTKKGYNYAQIQERKKSYLKATFYWSWENLIETIIKKYVDKLK